MTAEFEVLTGHLLVVGGRAVRLPPPGALIESAPRRAPRVREGDTFFILVTPTGEEHASAPFYEELARIAANAYFMSGGGVTGGLREALAAIHQHLIAIARDTGQHLLVSAAALVLRGEELYVARCGRTFAVLVQAGALTGFPAERDDPLSLSLPPLGADGEPDVQFARHRVGPGDSVLFANDGLLGADDAALVAALDSGPVAEMIERLKPLADRETSAMVIRFAPPGGIEAPAPAPEAAAPVPERDFAPPPDIAAEPDLTAPPEPEPLAGDGAMDPSPAAEAEPKAAPVSAVIGQVRRRASQVGSAASQVAQTTQARGPSAIQTARYRLRKGLRDVVRGILGALLFVTNGLSSLLDRILPAPDAEGRQGIPTNVAVGLAILIPVVIVIVVVGVALSRQGQTDFEVYLERAQTAYDNALALSGEGCENVTLRPSWIEVLELAEQARRFRPNDDTALRIEADARNYLDCYDRVQRRDLTVLHEFGSGADLVGPIISDSGVDLYTLNRTTGAVYHDTLNERGNGITTRNNVPIIRRGQAVGAYTVGDLFDIEWLRSGGTVHDNVLIALGSDGVLVSYSPTFFASAQQLVTEGIWVRPVAIAVFRSNLYVLDAGASQVWRYVPPAGERRYSNAPEEYFIGDSRPDLSTAVDLGISDDGAVYILFANGSVSKYRRDAQGFAEAQPFVYQDNPAGSLSSGEALFVDNDPASRNLYILDTLNETIYETSWAGTFRAAYRPRNMPDAFEGLTGMYAGTVLSNNMYVLAGNTLYHFPRTP